MASAGSLVVPGLMDSRLWRCVRAWDGTAAVGDGGVRSKKEEEDLRKALAASLEEN